MKNNILLILLSSLFLLTACEEGDHSQSSQAKELPYYYPPVVTPYVPPKPLAPAKPVEGEVTPEEQPKKVAVGAETCGYAFIDEADVSAVRDFWSEMNGLWLSEMPGYGVGKDEAGKQVYTKMGFEVSAGEGSFGLITFIYDQLFDEKSYSTKTPAPQIIAEARVSEVITSGDFAGYRFVETYDANSDFCRTNLVKFDSNKVSVQGVMNLSSGGGRRPVEEYFENHLSGPNHFHRM
jgi:hypothetical protein